MEVIQGNQLRLLMLGGVVDVWLDAMIQLEVTVALRQLLVEGSVVLAGLWIVYELSLINGVGSGLFRGG